MKFHLQKILLQNGLEVWLKQESTSFVSMKLNLNHGTTQTKTVGGIYTDLRKIR
jgi:hypothetical protein